MKDQNISIQKISYYGNKNTNKHNNNVRFYVHPFFNIGEKINIIDLDEKKRRSNVNVRDRIKVVKSRNITKDYTYPIVTDSMFGKYTDQYVMLLRTSKDKVKYIIKNYHKKIPAYILQSNDDPKKDAVFMIVLIDKIEQELLLK